MKLIRCVFLNFPGSIALTSCNHTLLDSAVTNSAVTNLVAISKPQASSYGLLIAGVILSVWGASLGYLLSIDLSAYPIGLVLLALLWQTFLYTGLFITAHDAMHGSVCPRHPKINAWVGKLALNAYGLLSYQTLLHKHHLHHRHPATLLDPDFHNGRNPHPIAWYVHFMKGYWNWRQQIGLALLYSVAQFGLQIPAPNLVLFWIMPSLLSSVQLFYFGTFLTHREPAGGHTHPHRTQSNALPVVWSFLTCYHFGYHEEHHEYPCIPWWQLPKLYQHQSGSGLYTSDRRQQ